MEFIVHITAKDTGDDPPPKKKQRQMLIAPVDSRIPAGTTRNDIGWSRKLLNSQTPIFLGERARKLPRWLFVLRMYSDGVDYSKERD